MSNKAVAVKRTNRRNLLIVRAGDNSLHSGWLDPSRAGERNWDLHISFFGTQTPEESEGITISHEQGPKWIGLATCLDKLAERLDLYDYIAFPDDDLFASQATWNRMFEICRRFGLDLAQPALDRRSFYSHRLTLQRPEFLLRYTNFVEIMAPILSRDALAKVRSLFTANLTGWGMDYVWPKVIGVDRRKIAIIDETPILHTRGIGRGSHYAAVKKAGITSAQERDRLMEIHGVRETKPICTEAVRHSGVSVRPPLDLPQIGPIVLSKWRRVLGVKVIRP